jgi:hypothetical protein
MVLHILLRVTTCYWKSQRKVGHLTKIDRNGEVLTEIVTEDYKVTDKPIYDTRLFKNKTKENLILENTLIGSGLMKFGVVLKLVQIFLHSGV